MSTLVLHPSALSIVSPGESWAVLCSHCERLRSEVLGGAELLLLDLAVVSGCCHDCGGGFCMCRGALVCDLCPRRNSPAIIQGLSVYRVKSPPAPDTVPSALEETG